MNKQNNLWSNLFSSPFIEKILVTVSVTHCVRPKIPRSAKFQVFQCIRIDENRGDTRGHKARPLQISPCVSSESINKGINFPKWLAAFDGALGHKSEWTSCTSIFRWVEFGVFHHVQFLFLGFSGFSFALLRGPADRFLCWVLL